MTGNPRALHLDEPLSIDEARTAARVLARQRRDAEQTHEDFVREAASKEADYRLAFARSFVAAEGTAAEREAIAKSISAQAARERDIAAGMVKVMAERLRGLEGERSMLKSFVDWSSRMQMTGEA